MKFIVLNIKKRNILKLNEKKKAKEILSALEIASYKQITEEKFLWVIDKTRVTKQW